MRQPCFSREEVHKVSKLLSTLKGRCRVLDTVQLDLFSFLFWCIPIRWFSLSWISFSNFRLRSHLVLLIFHFVHSVLQTAPMPSKSLLLHLHFVFASFLIQPGPQEWIVGASVDGTHLVDVLHLLVKEGHHGCQLTAALFNLILCWARSATSTISQMRPLRITVDL